MRGMLFSLPATGCGAPWGPIIGRRGFLRMGEPSFLLLKWQQVPTKPGPTSDCPVYPHWCSGELASCLQEVVHTQLRVKGLFNLPVALSPPLPTALAQNLMGRGVAGLRQSVRSPQS